MGFLIGLNENNIGWKRRLNLSERGQLVCFCLNITISHYMAFFVVFIDPDNAGTGDKKDSCQNSYGGYFHILIYNCLHISDGSIPRRCILRMKAGSSSSMNLRRLPSRMISRAPEATK